MPKKLFILKLVKLIVFFIKIPILLRNKISLESYGILSGINPQDLKMDIY